jgi:hypothetical protein
MHITLQIQYIGLWENFSQEYEIISVYSYKTITNLRIFSVNTDDLSKIYVHLVQTISITCGLKLKPNCTIGDNILLCFWRDLNTIITKYMLIHNYKHTKLNTILILLLCIFRILLKFSFIIFSLIILIIIIIML